MLFANLSLKKSHFFIFSSKIYKTICVKIFFFLKPQGIQTNHDYFRVLISVDNETLTELAELRKNNTFLERVYGFAANSLKRMTSDLADRDRQISILQEELQGLLNQTVKSLPSRYNI